MPSLDHLLDAYRSASEARVAASLAARNVRYRYEQSLFVFDYGKPRVWQPDFFLPDFSLFVECYGSADADYAKVTRKKQAVYHANAVPVVAVYPRHLASDLDRYLASELREYAHSRLRRSERLRERVTTPASEAQPEARLKELGLRYRLDRPVYFETAHGPRLSTADFYLPDFGHYVSFSAEPDERERFRENAISVTAASPRSARWDRELADRKSVV